MDIGTLFDRAISRAMHGGRPIALLVLVWAVLRCSIYVAVQRPTYVQLTIVGAILGLVLGPAFLALLGGRRANLSAALLWSARRWRTNLACTALAFAIYNIWPILLYGVLYGRFGYVAAFSAHALLSVVLAPLSLATIVMLPEAFLEERAPLDALRIGWTRCVMRRPGRSWRYGSVLFLTLFVGELIIIFVGGLLDRVIHLHGVMLHAAYGVSSALSQLGAAAFAIVLADALRSEYAGADLEAAIGEASSV